MDHLLWERDTILEDLKGQLCKAQNAMKLWADKKRRDITFEMGDAVYLKARPYRFKPLASLPNEKPSQRFYGPFEVLERTGNFPHRMALPSHSRNHPIFHVSTQVKKAIGAGEVGQQLPPNLTEEWDLQVKPIERYWE